MRRNYTMTNEERNEYLEALQEDCPLKISVLDGFEDCLLYYTEDEEGNRRAVYCYEDLVEHFAKTNKCTYLEAVEFIDYNTIRTIPYMTKVGNVSTTTPIIIHRIDPTYTTLDDSYFEKEYSDT